jgi:hypothetical protein
MSVRQLIQELTTEGEEARLVGHGRNLLPGRESEAGRAIRTRVRHRRMRVSSLLTAEPPIGTDVRAESAKTPEAALAAMGRRSTPRRTTGRGPVTSRSRPTRSSG